MVTVHVFYWTSKRYVGPWHAQYQQDMRHWGNSTTSGPCIKHNMLLSHTFLIQYIVIMNWTHCSGFISNKVYRIVSLNCRVIKYWIFFYSVGAIYIMITHNSSKIHWIIFYFCGLFTRLGGVLHNTLLQHPVKVLLL